ncbi:MAG: DMT family transporter [Hyphomonas oceanitis]|uniref:DMT family transporter n=1 Tax=Hyphomonas oceanitis TaxID=81033 RepID=UPI003001642C
MIARLLSAPLLLAVLAVAMGSGIDALVKATAPGAGVMVLVAWRFLFGAMIATTVFLVQRRAWPKREAVLFHIMRSLMQVASAILLFYALTQLALAETVLIGFTAALMVPFAAWLILGEAVSPRAFGLTLLGFAGAAFAVSATPEGAVGAHRLLGIASILASAMLYAVVLVLLRLRAVKEDATTIALFTNGVPALCLSPFLFGLAGPVNVNDLPVFALLGAIGYAVWYLLTLAYARARAQLLAPLEYTALIWAALIGFVFFDEVPGWRVAVGAVLIVAACLGVAFESHFATRRETGQPVSDLPD